MGLTIHYRFRLHDQARLPEFIVEVEDICTTMKWKSHRFDHVIDVEAKAMPFEKNTSMMPILMSATKAIIGKLWTKLF
jgi:hypothetical protein